LGGTLTCRFPIKLRGAKRIQQKKRSPGANLRELQAEQSREKRKKTNTELLCKAPRRYHNSDAEQVASKRRTAGSQETTGDEID